MTFPADIVPAGQFPIPHSPVPRAPREMVQARAVALVQAVLLVILALGWTVLALTYRSHDPVGLGITVVFSFIAAVQSLVAAGLVGVPALLMLEPRRGGSRTTLVVVEWLTVAYAVSNLASTIWVPIGLFAIPYVVGAALADTVLLLLARPNSQQWCARV